MLNMARLANYPGLVTGKGVHTGPQLRRLKHKQLSRKTHAHITGQRCERCRPAPKEAVLDPAAS